MKAPQLQQRGGRRRPAAAATPLRVAGQIGELATGSALSRRTIRLRLTLLYGTLFLLSGAGLLAIAYFLATRSPFLAYSAVTSPAAIKGSGSPSAPRSVLGSSRLTAGQAAAVAREFHDWELAQHAAEMHHLLVWSLAAFGAMAAVSLILGWAVAGRALGPLRRIIAAARDISATSLHERLSLPGPDDELKELGDTFDALLERLEAAFDSQRRFVANASHELRTPLTIIRAAVDIALRKREPPPSPQVIALAGRVSQGLDQVESILDSFLLLARADHGAAQAGRAVVSLPDLACSAIAARAGEARTPQICVSPATAPCWRAWWTTSPPTPSATTSRAGGSASPPNATGPRPAWWHKTAAPSSTSGRSRTWRNPSGVSARNGPAPATAWALGFPSCAPSPPPTAEPWTCTPAPRAASRSPSSYPP
jgi:signal transduction histidine kinase